MTDFSGGSAGVAGKIVSRPTFLTYGNYSFILMDAPTDSTLPFYLAVFNTHGVKTVVRACEATYSTDRLLNAGIKVVSMDFPDGEAPPSSVLKAWRELRLRSFGRFKQEYVHVVPNVSESDQSTSHETQTPRRSNATVNAVSSTSPRGIIGTLPAEQKDIPFSPAIVNPTPTADRLSNHSYPMTPNSYYPSAGNSLPVATAVASPTTVAAETKNGQVLFVVPPKHVEIDPSIISFPRCDATTRHSHHHSHHGHHHHHQQHNNQHHQNHSSGHHGTFTPSKDARPIIALHCIAGLGRAPLLVAVALLDAGLRADEVIRLIRSKRKGAFNSVQVEFLQSYIPPSQNGCCTVS